MTPWHAQSYYRLPQLKSQMVPGQLTVQVHALDIQHGESFPVGQGSLHAVMDMTRATQAEMGV